MARFACDSDAGKRTATASATSRYLELTRNDLLVAVAVDVVLGRQQQVVGDDERGGDDRPQVHLQTQW